MEANLTDWPHGTLPAATMMRDELEVRALSHRAIAAEAASAVEAAEALLAEADADLDDQRRRLSQGERLVSQLERLTENAAHAAAASVRAATLRQEQRTLETEAGSARKRRVEARQMVATARRRRETTERALDRVQQELASLPEPADGPTADGDDLAELQAAYESANDLVAKATADSELSRRLETLDHERQSNAAEWSALGPDLRERAGRLAATPSAADPVARHKAEDAAVESAADAANRFADTRSRLGVEEAGREELPQPEPSWPVEPFPIPGELNELETFAAELHAANDAARERRSSATEAFEEARSACGKAKADREALEAQATALSAGIGEREPRPAVPFVGDTAEAVKHALRRIADANTIREAADDQWRRAANAITRFARDHRWGALTGELARHLRDDSDDELARASADLLTQTRILEERLRDDIAHLDTHRRMLVNSLADAVSEAARSLRSARKKSELPSGLGDWSHQPFLRIRLDLAKDRAEVDGRLRRFTNDLLERAATASASLPVGADLVCQALLACAERAVTVDVLKPNKGQRLRYVPITETATLSGGMRATAAIAMFCTLAKVRAANRTSRVGVGTLVLDNPLGDANATHLVALQRLVAQMNDVQLVYTTGVNDMDALRLFPVVTRLTNEGAKRSHLAYVIADEAFLKRLAPPDGDNAIVTGSRLVRRQEPLLAGDLATMDGDEDDGS